MDQFKITIDRESNTISVYNNGRGIPIQMHDKEQMYIPELIFGNLSVHSSTTLSPHDTADADECHFDCAQSDVVQLRRRREEADGRSKRFRSKAHKHLLALVQSVRTLIF